MAYECVWRRDAEVVDARQRYDQVVIGNRLIQLANSIARKVDQLAIAAVEAALTKYSTKSSILLLALSPVPIDVSLRLVWVCGSELNLQRGCLGAFQLKPPR